MIYAQIGNTFCKYQGMSQETILAMLTEQNLTFTFISEEVYKQKMAEVEAQIGTA
jgi:hypothetical protein